MQGLKKNMKSQCQYEKPVSIWKASVNMKSQCQYEKPVSIWKNQCQYEKPVSIWKNQCQYEKPVSIWKASVNMKSQCQYEKPVSIWKASVNMKSQCQYEKPVSIWKASVNMKSQCQYRWCPDRNCNRHNQPSTKQDRTDTGDNEPSDSTAEPFYGVKSKVAPVDVTKACRKCRGRVPLILNLDTRWRRAANFMPPPPQTAIPPVSIEQCRPW